MSKVIGDNNNSVSNNIMYTVDVGVGVCVGVGIGVGVGDGSNAIKNLGFLPGELSNDKGKTNSASSPNIGHVSIIKSTGFFSVFAPIETTTTPPITISIAGRN